MPIAGMISRLRIIGAAQPSRLAKALFFIQMAFLVVVSSGNSDGGSPQQEFLEKFQTEREQVKSFSADFIQKKTLPLFGEEKTSTGKVLFKAPHQMIWKYKTPDKTQMRVTSEAVSFYFPSLEQIEVYRMNQGKGAAPFFFAFEATAEELAANFDISGPVDVEGLRRVELTPKSEPLAAEVKSVTLWLDQSDYLPRKLLISEITGDTTEITFDNIRINRPLADEDLQLDAPEGTEVIEENAGI